MLNETRGPYFGKMELKLNRFLVIPCKKKAFTQECMCDLEGCVTVGHLLLAWFCPVSHHQPPSNTCYFGSTATGKKFLRKVRVRGSVTCGRVITDNVY